jgi:hypothetical protein
MANVIEFVEQNAIPLAIGAGVVGIGAGVATAAVLGSSSKKKARKSSGRSRDRKYISKQRHERSRRRKRPGKIYGKKGLYFSRSPLRKAGNKKKRKGSKKIYYARKTGQPYILLASGKAKFIKGKRRKR